jgi:cardiolipin synthase
MRQLAPPSVHSEPVEGGFPEAAAPGTSEQGGPDEIDTTSAFTVPNAISAIRVILLAPLFVAASKRNEAAMVAILAAIGVSDWADGVAARALHQISKVGQIFDPVCDRIAVAGSLIGVIVTGYFPVSLGAVLLVREAVVSVATITLSIAGWPRIKVTLLGKAATLMLMFSLPLYVVAGSGWDSASTAEFLAKAFSYPGAVAYYIALGQYGVAAWKLAPARRKVE